MPRSARKTQPAAEILTVSVHALLDAASRGVISLTPAEVKGFRKLPKTTPVDLRGEMAEAMYADALPDRKPTEFGAALVAEPVVKARKTKVAKVIEAIEALPEIPLEKPAKKAKAIHTTPAATVVNVAPVPVAEPTTKKAKKAVAAPAKAKGTSQSRSPEARRTRRIIREYLRVSLVATDENEDAEIRECAAARAAHLEQLIGAAL